MFYTIKQTMLLETQSFEYDDNIFWMLCTWEKGAMPNYQKEGRVNV